MAKTIAPPTLLNYSGSIQPSVGVFHALKKEEHDGNPILKHKVPVQIEKTTVRGTISNFSNVHKADGKQVSENEVSKTLSPENANIQRIEVSYLPPGHDYFSLSFSLTFCDNSLQPGAVNEADIGAALEELTREYKEKGGYHYLAAQYARNLVNARWMWRNRYCAHRQVTITLPETNQEWVFKVENDLGHDYSKEPGFGELVDAIAKALGGETPPLRVYVEGTGFLGNGQQIFPSQEFVDQDSRSGKKEGKVLARIAYGDSHQAAMHPQKIGNAIRTIDIWHSEKDSLGPIPIEPYGVIQRESRALRLPGNEDKDFYTHFKNLPDHIARVKAAKTGADIDGHIHYFVANLIRGGVFSGEKKDKGKAK